MSMDKPVNVRLREAELLDRGRHLAEMLERRDRMVSDKKQAAREAQEEIDALDEEISAEARVIRHGFEQRRQGDLFVDQMPSTDRVAANDVATPTIDESQRALHDIAAAASQEPKPTDPHPYEGLAAEVDQCRVCDARESDPVHHGGDLLPHVFAPAVEDGTEGLVCTFEGCGRGESDAVHDLAGEARPEHRDDVLETLAASPREAVIFAQHHLRDIELAWTLAHNLNPTDGRTWADLADAYEKVNPVAVLPILRRLVLASLGEADARSYKHAARLLSRMRRIAAGTEHATEVDSLIAALREEHRSRPRLQREFEAAKLH